MKSKANDLRYQPMELLEHQGRSFMITGVFLEVRADPEDTKQRGEIIIRFEEVEEK